jgi:hypothetical protein
MKSAALVVLALAAAVVSAMSISFVENNGATNVFQMNGVGAGAFDPNNLKNWQYDQRQPFIGIQGSGQCRNIYAANAVQNGQGPCWNVYFGGWDGTAESPPPYICHDQVSITVTEDAFATMNPHYLIVENGPVNLLNNPSVIRYREPSPNSSAAAWAMVYTQLPYAPVLNKPGISFSADGVTWSPGQGGKFISMYDYPNDWSAADVNGGNVLAHDPVEGQLFHLFFIDFKNFDGVYHATSTDLQNFYYKSVACPGGLVVNDVKKINGYWLMAMHENGPNVFFSVSLNLSSPFSPPVVLFPHFSAQDSFMVSITLVVDRDTTLLGALYGATDESALMGNHIYAAWLQRRVLFKSIDNATTVWGLGAASRGLGPYSSVIDINAPAMLGRFWVYEADFDPTTESGTLLFVSSAVTVRSGDIWELHS